MITVASHSSPSQDFDNRTQEREREIQLFFFRVNAERKKKSGSKEWSLSCGSKMCVDAHKRNKTISFRHLSVCDCMR